MISKGNSILLGVAMTIVFSNLLFSQTNQKITETNQTVKDDTLSESTILNKFNFYTLRGSNAIDGGLGSAIANGDFPNAEFEIYFRIGYKHHLTDHLNYNLTYNKYNIAFEDILNEGFMSFDLNLELLFCPYSKFTPYIYAGGGYNAGNGFENTTPKVQGGLGFEIIVADHVGIKLFGEYNYLFSDELDGLVSGESDDTVIQLGLGFNFYFGGSKKREALRKRMPTVINSNPIPLKNKKQSLPLNINNN